MQCNRPLNPLEITRHRTAHTVQNQICLFFSPRTLPFSVSCVWASTNLESTCWSLSMAGGTGLRRRQLRVQRLWLLIWSEMLTDTTVQLYNILTTHAKFEKKKMTFKRTRVPSLHVLGGGCYWHFAHRPLLHCLL